MEYRNLGRSGVKVSPLCLGAMNFGSPTEESEAIRIIHAALDAGINFIDTADCYVHGRSEEIVGKALDGGRRDQVVLATKLTSGTGGQPPNAEGSSRYRLMRACDDSLRRLRTDRIDLCQLHWMDFTTPLEESLRALDDLVRQGKVLYTGCSKFVPPYLAEAMMLCRQNGWSGFVSEQPPYNILSRTIENDLIWTCQRFGIGIIPWAPIAGGILSGKYSKGSASPAGSRFDSADGPRLHLRAIEAADALKPIAADKGVELAVFALAWVMNQPGITSPITGPRMLKHLQSSLKALDLDITDEDRRRVDAIVPPGTWVSDYYDMNVYHRLRSAIGVEEGTD